MKYICIYYAWGYGYILLSQEILLLYIRKEKGYRKKITTVGIPFLSKHLLSGNLRHRILSYMDISLTQQDLCLWAVYLSKKDDGRDIISFLLWKCSFDLEWRIILPHYHRARYLFKKMKEGYELIFFISLLKRPRWQTLSPPALEDSKTNRAKIFSKLCRLKTAVFENN